MTLYGLLGFTHHGGRLLTVMSPQGATAAAAHIRESAGVRAVVRPGRLPQYHEIRHGALATLIERHHIELLQADDWNARKALLGEAVYV